MMKPISFDANLNRIATTIDGGWRITFDVSASEQQELLSIAHLREENLRVCVFTAQMISEYNNTVTNGEEHA